MHTISLLVCIYTMWLVFFFFCFVLESLTWIMHREWETKRRNPNTSFSRLRIYQCENRREKKLSMRSKSNGDCMRVRDFCWFIFTYHLCIFRWLHSMRKHLKSNHHLSSKGKEKKKILTDDDDDNDCAHFR